MSRKGRAALRLGMVSGLTVLIGLGLYVRYAPTDPERWHRMPENVESHDLEHGAIRVEPGDEEDLRRLHRIILDTARTRVVAGSVEDGMITYVTRSAVFRFPDYTTVRHRDTRIEIFGRLRFGQSDIGVNAARIDRWLQALSDGR